MLDEFRPQLRIIHLLQRLELLLLFDGSHHGEAVSIRENLLNKSPNSILLVDVVAASLLVHEGALEVLLA